MRRRHLPLTLLIPLCGGPRWAVSQTPSRVGVVLLHGKYPGGPQSPQIQQLAQRMIGSGWLVVVPNMPWSRTRYLQGDWDGVMAEMADHVRGLRARGATHIVVAAQSMGCPATLSHAARGGDAQALVLLAPGHVPAAYHSVPSLQAVRQSIDEARSLVAAGKGEEPHRFNDINQGKPQSVVTSARAYLSFFDPASDAEMSVTAPRVPAGVPIFVGVGRQDPLHPSLRTYLMDRLPANPHTRLFEYAGGHLDTPVEAADDLLGWVPKALGI